MNEKKKKLLEILKKISTPEEMRSFEAEFIGESNDKAKNEILKAIKENKTEIKWDFVSNLIGNLEKKVLKGLEDLMGKKFPVYNDKEVQKKLDEILKEGKTNEIIKEADAKNRLETVGKLTEIRDVIIELGTVLSQEKPDEFKKVNENLEGIGRILNNILGLTGQNAGLATEETLQSISGMGIPAFDSIEASYPTSTQEVYTYIKDFVTVATVTVEYTDSSKDVLSSVTKS